MCTFFYLTKDEGGIRHSPKEILEALDTNAQGQNERKLIPGACMWWLNQRACKLCNEGKQLPMAVSGQRREIAGELMAAPRDG